MTVRNDWSQCNQQLLLPQTSPVKIRLLSNIEHALSLAFRNLHNMAHLELLISQVTPRNLAVAKPKNQS